MGLRLLVVKALSSGEKNGIVGVSMRSDELYCSLIHIERTKNLDGQAEDIESAGAGVGRLMGSTSGRA